jgi:hypothetical protein
MKPILALALLLIGTKSFAQAYIRASAGNNVVSIGVQAKAESIKKLTYGFGISVFLREGKKGMDYTNIYSPESPDIYEVVGSQNTSIFGLLGIILPKRITVLTKVGLGAKAWYYNGKTNDQFWFTSKNGGTYLLYGADITKAIGKHLLIGCGYDNFNGFELILGVKFN